MFLEKRWRLVALSPIEQVPMENPQAAGRVISGLGKKNKGLVGT